jgi:hypothetical protein
MKRVATDRNRPTLKIGRQNACAFQANSEPAPNPPISPPISNPMFWGQADAAAQADQRLDPVKPSRGEHERAGARVLQHSRGSAFSLWERVLARHLAVDYANPAGQRHPSRCRNCAAAETPASIGVTGTPAGGCFHNPGGAADTPMANWLYQQGLPVVTQGKLKHCFTTARIVVSLPQRGTGANKCNPPIMRA